MREYNITKREWVLNGDTVQYAHVSDIIMALDYDMQREKRFSFACLSQDKQVEHIAHFIADIWQVHPFPEGNTRTTAVFCIKYLRHLGFQVNNEPFARHARYFRNALVRANYTNVPAGIDADYSFLIKFFRNLLLNENNELKNRSLVINAPEELTPQADPTSTPQAPHKLIPEDSFCQKLILVIGNDSCSVKTMMEQLKLSDRKNFLNNYLNPAIKAGFVRLLYPDSPRHPRQKYLLTVKGLAVLADLAR
jgi:hypothetical protein